MMNTIIVVRTRFLEGRPGHLVDALAPHFAEELEDTTAGTRSRPPANSLPPVPASTVFLVVSAILFFHCLQLAGVEGLEPTAYGFGDRRSTN